MTHIEQLRQQLAEAIAANDTGRAEELRELIQLHKGSVATETRNIERIKKQRDDEKK